jgi:hypothetical protein
MSQLQGIKEAVEKEEIDCHLFVTRSFDVMFEESHALGIRDWLTEQRKGGATWTELVQWLEGENLDKVSMSSFACAVMC